MLLITDKQRKAIIDKLDARIAHIDESIKNLRDEVRRIHVLQTCGAEPHYIKEINQKLFNIEEGLSKVILVKKVKRKGREKSEQTT